MTQEIEWSSTSGVDELFCPDCETSEQNCTALMLDVIDGKLKAAYFCNNCKKLYNKTYNKFPIDPFDIPKIEKVLCIKEPK